MGRNKLKNEATYGKKISKWTLKIHGGSLSGFICLMADSSGRL
jgi:hypothetical protein